MCDTSAWKTGDKAWTKARQAQWKAIKQSLEQACYFVEKKHHKYLKSFFLTGTYPETMYKGDYPFPVAEYKPDQPFYFIEAAVLLECWLTADPSEKCWQRIKQKYPEYQYWDSRRRFRETLTDYPETGTLFGGLEERLYRFFGPTRCRPEDYPQLSEEKFLEEAGQFVYPQLGNALSAFLATDCPNPHNFVQFAVQEFVDSIVPAREWGLKKYSTDVIQIPYYTSLACLVLATPEGRDPVQLEVAREVDRLLEGTDFPAPVKALIAQGRAQAEAELAKTRR